MNFLSVLKISVLMLLIMATIPAIAHKEEVSPINLGLLPYTFNPENVPEFYATLMQKDIVAFLENDKRFVLSQKEGFSENRLNYDRQDIIEAGKLQGAQYLISIHFNKLLLKTNKKKTQSTANDGIITDFFYCDLQFSLRVYDVAKGELRTDEIIFASSELNLLNPDQTLPNIPYEDLLKRGFETAEKEMRKNAKEQIKVYFDKIFPYKALVKSIDAPTQLGSCIVSVDGGTDIGFSKNGYYVLYILEDYMEEDKILKRKRNLAELLKVINLTANSAELKVYYGKNDVIRAYNDSLPIYCSPAQSDLELNPQQGISVAISPFSLKEEMDGNELEWLEELVSSSIVAHGRLKVVERKNINAIFTEKELQKTEAFLDAEVMEQGKSLGAEYVLFGEAYEFKTWYHTKKQDLEPNSGYYTNLKVGIKVVNTATGKVEAAKIISVNQFQRLSNPYFSSENNSQAAALDFLKQKINWMILQTFPLELKIVEITNVSKKGEAKNLLINGGSAYGLDMRWSYAKIPFEVFEVNEEMVDGKMLERTVEIGEIVLKEVENDLISECKVKNCGDVIQNNFQSGKKMICRIKESYLSD